MSVMPLPTTVGVMSDTAGDRYKARRTAIGLSVSALAKRAHVDRGSLTALEQGQPVRDTTLAAIEKALAELEHELGMDEPSAVSLVSPEPVAEKPHTIRFEVQGVYGAKALIVEGPVDDLPALEAAVDRIMRRLAEGADEKR